jgi:hypothetical protein
LTLNDHEFSELYTYSTSGYHFQRATEHGIDVRVKATGTITIGIMSINLDSTPMIEIQIGTQSNQRSIIRRNQSTNVVDVSTPNILDYGGENAFKVMWEDGVVLVYRGSETSPFMVYAMEDSFGIDYFGLKSP